MPKYKPICGPVKDPKIVANGVGSRESVLEEMEVSNSTESYKCQLAGEDGFIQPSKTVLVNTTQSQVLIVTQNRFDTSQ